MLFDVTIEGGIGLFVVRTGARRMATQKRLSPKLETASWLGGRLLLTGSKGRIILPLPSLRLR